MRGLLGILIALLIFVVPTTELDARSRRRQAGQRRPAVTEHRAAMRPGRQRQARRRVRRRARRGRRCRRLGDRLEKLKYLHGGSVWIPKEARCGGSFPVVVLLHGNNTSKEKVKSLGGGRNLDRWARRELVPPERFFFDSVHLWEEGQAKIGAHLAQMLRHHLLAPSGGGSNPAQSM